MSDINVPQQDTNVSPQDTTPIYDISGEQPVLGHIAHDEVHDAISSGKFSFPQGKPINVIDPEGQLGTIDPKEAQQAFNNGFRYATPNDIEGIKYGGAGEGAKAFLEGVGEGIAGPLAPMAEKALGVSEEAIKGRAHQHEIAKGLGQATGLVGGMLTGTGEGALLEAAGKAAVEAAGIAQGTSRLAKIGSSAVQSAAEMAVLQGSDEASKMILHDPAGSAESAIANIGLASALGGATGAFVTGAVHPLWNATVGDRLSGALTSLTAKLGGLEGTETAKAIEIANKSGVPIPAEIAAKIEGNPLADTVYTSLANKEGDTYASKKFQKVLTDYESSLDNKLLENIGHTPSTLEKIPKADNYSTGLKAGDTLHDEIKQIAKPIQDEYEKITTKFKNTPIMPTNYKSMVDEISNLSMQEGWNKAAFEEQGKFVKNVLSDLKEIKTADELKRYMTSIRESNPFGKDNYQAAKKINNILSKGQDQAISDLAFNGNKALAAGEIENYQALKSKYSSLMNTMDSLNEHLHVGKYHGPESFLSALKEKSSSNGEAILRALSGKNKADVLNALAENGFEKTLNEIRQHHSNELIRDAMAKGSFDSAKFMKEYEKLSPQIKNLIADPTKQSSIEGIGQAISALKSSKAGSGFADKIADKIVEHGATPLSLIAAITGHGGEAIMANIAKLGLKEGGDAVKLSMLRHLSTNGPVKATAFKSMVDFAANSLKGQTLITRAAGNVFKSGAQVLTAKEMPDAKDRQKLDKIVTKVNEDPEATQKMLNGEVGHYLPNHQAELTKNVASQVQYLNQLKPKPTPNGPLGKPIEPTPEQEARYNRALDIANQPAVIFHHIKNGTLQTSDMQDLKALYPSLYGQYAQKLSEAMANVHHDEQLIPYKTQLSASLFLGQPLDNSMTPQAIQAAQLANKIGSKQGQQPQNQPMHNRKGTNSLGKSNSTYNTPGQAAERDRAGRD